MLQIFMCLKKTVEGAIPYKIWKDIAACQKENMQEEGTVYRCIRACVD